MQKNMVITSYMDKVCNGLVNGDDNELIILGSITLVICECVGDFSTVADVRCPTGDDYHDHLPSDFDFYDIKEKDICSIFNKNASVYLIWTSQLPVENEQSAISEVQMESSF